MEVQKVNFSLFLSATLDWRDYWSTKQSPRITSSHEIKDQMGNKCLENGFYLMGIDLIALLLKISIKHGIDHQKIIATIAL